MANKLKTFAIGDIHGGYRALKQCLERSKFNYKKDRLICLGDVADGWSEVYECIEELLKINNLVYIIGNHDSWLMEWLTFGATPHIWTSQGGQASIDSYMRLLDSQRLNIMKAHLDFLNKGVYYFIDEKNRAYVHGGFDWHYPIEETNNYDLTWDRHMWITANMWHNNKNDKDRKMGTYDEIFIGHTSTSYYDKELKPMRACNVWNLDQGGGFEGKLTIMDVDTKEYFQSDVVKTLYPEDKGR